MMNSIRPEYVPMTTFNENLDFKFSVFDDVCDKSIDSDCLLVCLPGTDPIMTPQEYFNSLNENLSGTLYNIIEAAKDNSTLKKENSFISFNIPPNIVKGSRLKNISLFSTGDKKHTTPDFLNKICTNLANINKQSKIKINSYTLLICLDDVIASDIMLFCTQFPFITTEETRFKGNCSDDNNEEINSKRVEVVNIVLKQRTVKTECEGLLSSAISTSKGLLFARDLTSAPSNYCNPVNMANEVIKMANSVGLDVELLQQRDCEELKMGAYLAVAQGSESPPQFVHLTYRPKGEIKKKVAFVGKGITMDTGGYNIKHSMIHFMKGDMGGAAAVFGAAYAVGLSKPDNVEVHFISAICDNLISAEAYLPGCIVTASNGKTIEVGNTDAEGRLTLADALVYACRLNVDTIVDLATLTGFSYKLFEGMYASVLSNDDHLFSVIKDCGKAVCEKFWQLPLDPDYKDYIVSKIADLNNTSEGKAPVSTSALFLYEFVSEGISYAHIDIAGCSGMDTLGNGFGVKTVVSLIKEFSKQTH